MEETLTEAIYAMEDWTMHRNFNRAASLVRAERLADQHRVGQASITERVIGVARLWKGYHGQLTHPAQVADLVERIEQYRLDMESLGYSINTGWRFTWDIRRVLLILGIQSILVALLPPLLFVGYIINTNDVAIRCSAASCEVSERSSVGSVVFIDCVLSTDGGFGQCWRTVR